MMIPRTPDVLRHLFPDMLFRIPSESEKQPSVYLTFDDGPHPAETEFVLRCLHDFGAKATFFVTGMQAEKNPDGLAQIRGAGHHVANHGYSHLKAGKVSAESYLNDAEKGALITGSRLFRPPYGYLTPSLYKALRKKNRIALWDVITEDYRQDKPSELLLESALKKVRNGSLVVFHDQPRASKHLSYVLPRLMERLNQQNVAFHSLALFEPIVELDVHG
jgi:peptidoglycan/xylan/chitin deacetylase (PgdA/CDA1 family)